MNPMTNVKNIKKLSEEELKGRNRTSWHDQYRGSAWIFVGGLPYDLTEGDIVCVFSQYGEPVNVNLVRDKDSGKSKGFCFICYEDQRSTDLAVDNFNGIKVLGRTIRVDHVENYKPPKSNKDESRDKTREIVKHKIKEERLSDEEISSCNTTVEGSVSKKRNKKRQESEIDSEDNDKRKRKRKKGSKKQKKRKNLEGDHSSESERERKKWNKHKLKPSSSTSSSSSSSSTSPSSSDTDEVDRQIRKKHSKSVQLKRNRTIEDLKREAKLIHAELKRRQRQEEQDNTHFDLGVEHRRKRDRKASR